MQWGVLSSCCQPACWMEQEAQPFAWPEMGAPEGLSHFIDKEAESETGRQKVMCKDKGDPHCPHSPLPSPSTRPALQQHPGHLPVPPWPEHVRRQVTWCRFRGKGPALEPGMWSLAPSHKASSCVRETLGTGWLPRLPFPVSPRSPGPASWGGQGSDLSGRTSGRQKPEPELPFGT